MGSEMVLLLLSVLIALTGFLGARLFARLDKLSDSLNSLCLDHGQRLTRLESR